jgi:hypothetical protein
MAGTIVVDVLVVFVELVVVEDELVVVEDELVVAEVTLVVDAELVVLVLDVVGTVMRVVVVGAIVASVVVVSVAPVVSQSMLAQASQQLADSLAHPPLALHFSRFLIVHLRADPLAMQHVTTFPLLPHTDRAAHRRMMPLQFFGRSPALARWLATRLTQRTYAP